MTQCLRLLPCLLAPVLLVSFSACSKKDAVEVKNLASYTLDGQFRKCLITQAASTQAEFDYLTLSLTTTPQPSSGPEVLEIKLWKLTGQPNGTYNFMYDGSSSGMIYTTNQLPSVGYYLTSITKVSTNSSGFTGAFTGEARTATGPGTYTVAHTITGNLTNVQL